MAVKSMLGKRTQFWMKDKVYEGTQTYTQVANVRNLGDISATSTTVDVTEYGEGNMRQYIAGLGETTDMQITLASESPSVDAFETAYDEGTEQAIKVVLPSGKILKFDGAITNFSYSIPVDGAYAFGATIKPSGNMKRAYTIKFDANGGTGSMADVEAAGNTTYTIPASTFTAPAGKVFSKWNTLADGTGTDYAVDTTIVPTIPMKLFAIWNTIPTYTISFNANGGTGTMESVTVQSGTAYTIPASTFTAPEGKTFSKWNTASDGSGTDYQPAASVTISAALDLFAIWV